MYPDHRFSKAIAAERYTHRSRRPLDRNSATRQ